MSGTHSFDVSSLLRSRMKPQYCSYKVTSPVYLLTDKQQKTVTWVLAPGASLPLSKVLEIRTGKQSFPHSLTRISSDE